MQYGLRKGLRGNLDEILFEDFKTGKTDANTSYVWGTHALVIPAADAQGGPGFCRLPIAD